MRIIDYFLLTIIVRIKIVYIYIYVKWLNNAYYNVTLTYELTTILSS